MKANKKYLISVSDVEVNQFLFNEKAKGVAYAASIKKALKEFVNAEKARRNPISAAS